MKSSLVFCLSLVFFSSFSQYNSEFLSFENRGRSIAINGEYEFGSNGIYNSLLNKFIFGGYIDNSTKDASNSKMYNTSVLGANMNYNISAFFGRKAKYSYLIGFKGAPNHISSSTSSSFLSS